MSFENLVFLLLVSAGCWDFALRWKSDCPIGSGECPSLTGKQNKGSNDHARFMQGFPPSSHSCWPRGVLCSQTVVVLPES